METMKCDNQGQIESPTRTLIAGDYIIPDGFSAEINIEGGKVFVRKKETEFERVRKELLSAVEKGRVFDIDKPVADRWEAFLEGLESIGESSAKNCAISFIEFLDKNSYEGKMCVSNPECEDIVNAFVEKDWAKLVAYVNKYLRGAAEGRTVPLSSKCQEWIDAVENVAGAFPPGSKGYDMVIGSIHDLIKYLKSPCLENRMWSEEDDRICHLIMANLSESARHAITLPMETVNEFNDWLRTLQCMPPLFTDWTDEDEALMSDAMACITLVQAKKGIGELKEFHLKYRTDELRSWIRSLKSRPRKQPHWKPSEEQMVALKRAIEEMEKIDSNTASTLALLKFNLQNS